MALVSPPESPISRTFCVFTSPRPCQVVNPFRLYEGVGPTVWPRILPTLAHGLCRASGSQLVSCSVIKVPTRSAGPVPRPLGGLLLEL